MAQSLKDQRKADRQNKRKAAADGNETPTKARRVNIEAVAEEIVEAVTPSPSKQVAKKTVAKKVPVSKTTTTVAVDNTPFYKLDDESLRTVSLKTYVPKNKTLERYISGTDMQFNDAMSVGFQSWVKNGDESSCIREYSFDPREARDSYMPIVNLVVKISDRAAKHLDEAHDSIVEDFMEHERVLQELAEKEFDPELVRVMPFYRKVTEGDEKYHGNYLDLKVSGLQSWALPAISYSGKDRKKFEDVGKRMVTMITRLNYVSRKVQDVEYNVQDQEKPVKLPTAFYNFYWNLTKIDFGGKLGEPQFR